MTLIPVANLFTESWNITKANWRTTLKWTLPLIGLTFLSSLVSNSISFAFKLTEPTTQFLGVAITMLVSLATALVGIILGFGLMRDLAMRVLSITNPIPFWTAIRRIIGAVFIQVLLMMVSYIPLVLLGLGVYFLAKQTETNAFFILFFPLVMGFIAFITWFTAAVGFSSMAILDQGTGSRDAIRTSLALVKNRWWATFGRNIATAIALLIPSAAEAMILIPAGIILVAIIATSGIGMEAIESLNPDNAMSILTSGSAGIVIVSSVLLFMLFAFAIRIPVMLFQMLFGSAAHIVLYRSLKETKGQPAPAVPQFNQ